MDILLVGEYSRLHNSLKEGLIENGHRVRLAGFADGFKDYPVDLKFNKPWDCGFLRKIKVLVHKITGFNVSSYLIYRQFYKNRALFSGHDVVQLINENSFYCGYHYERKILEYIFRNNKKVFLLSCGSDYTNVRYCFQNPGFKSVVQPYLAGKIKKKDFLPVLKFRKAGYRKLHDYLYEHISGVIASDLDYHVPLAGHPKYLGMIPNPVNLEKLRTEDDGHSDKIVIFLGINQENYFRKGIDFFEKALAVIQHKYAKQVEIIVTRNLPYNQYISAYNRAHIILDQTYSLDQGYNALEAMAKGKVVFTGAEKLFETHYGLTEKVAVNALPDTDYIVKQLAFLIEHPEEIKAIGKRAEAFIKTQHDHAGIARKYVSIWE
ncbi:glycosyl transferase family 1 [Flavobacterium magnum]|uniref:Glycosyl transferase family 1 n=1 Tax=Flavobacterium magnum TaxID=2162713 RepID=A0A2S0RHT3_9FLAO|nr:glycosyltransferase [Flavobacterium magnum]AWA31226.1 glycosyl transferase family 1 [Flavobacterium magnum]